MEIDLLKKIGLALALGVLIGIEREFSQRREGEPLFVVILFVAKAALDFVGTRALYFTALIAGFIEVDAIALTTARLAQESLTASTAAAIIILAAMSNT